MVQCVHEWSTRSIKLKAACAAIALAHEIQQINIRVVQWEESSNARVDSLSMHCLGQVAWIPELELALLHGVAAGCEEMLALSTPHDAGMATAGVACSGLSRCRGTRIKKAELFVLGSRHQQTAVVVPRDGLHCRAVMQTREVKAQGFSRKIVHQQLLLSVQRHDLVRRRVERDACDGVGSARQRGYWTREVFMQTLSIRQAPQLQAKRTLSESSRRP